MVPTSLTGVPTTANGPALECSANVEAPIAVPTAVPISIPAPTTTPVATETTSTPTSAPTSTPIAPTPKKTAPTSTPVASTPVDSTTAPATTDTTTGDAPYLLGTFTTFAHNVTGTVYVISDHILEIQVCIGILVAEKQHFIFRVLNCLF
jgi:hypothetical protein